MNLRSNCRGFDSNLIYRVEIIIDDDDDDDDDDDG